MAGLGDDNVHPDSNVSGGRGQPIDPVETVLVLRNIDHVLARHPDGQPLRPTPGSRRRARPLINDPTLCVGVLHCLRLREPLKSPVPGLVQAELQFPGQDSRRHIHVTLIGTRPDAPDAGVATCPANSDPDGPSRTGDIDILPMPIGVTNGQDDPGPRTTLHAGSLRRVRALSMPTIGSGRRSTAHPRRSHRGGLARPASGIDPSPGVTPVGRALRSWTAGPAATG